MSASVPSLRKRSLDKDIKRSGSTKPDPIPTPADDLVQPQPTIFSSISANIRTLFELSFLVTVYIFQPWVFIEIYLLPTFAATAMAMNFNPRTSIPSLADKVILVTGGNAGLGKESILQLARHGPQKIYLGARSAEKATTAINSINNQLTVPTEIEHLPLDLSDLNSVKQAAELLQTKSSRLDILMLNAGIMATPSAKTAQGFDDQMGVNHVGHFYLTQLLLPLLERTAAAHKDPRLLDTILSTTRLTATSPWKRYGASKAANIMFTAELARRYPTLTTASVHPGVILTELHKPGQDSFSFVGWAVRLISPFVAQDVTHGAYNQLWAATAEVDRAVKSGSYYTPVGQAKNIKWATDKEAGRRCWDWTEEEIKKAGF